MHILFLNLYYPPDAAPTGAYLRDVAAELVRRGCRVTVLASAARYRAAAAETAAEHDEGVSVLRGSWASHARTPLGLFARYGAWTVLRGLAVRPRPDLVVALTSPPFLGLAARLIAAGRRAGHAHWVMDLYPDVLAAHGSLSEHSPLYRLLSAAARRQYAGARAVVAPAEDIAARLERHVPAGRGPRSPRRLVVPLWTPRGLTPAPAEEIGALRALRGWAPGDLVCMYAGNLGRGHTLDPFLAAAQAMAGEPAVRWVFAGSGPRLVEVEAARRASPGARIEILAPVAAGQLAAHLGSADVHLVSLRDEWAGCIAPSKLQAAFAVGRPVIYAGPPGSSTARWVEESGGGWSIGAGQPAAMAGAVREAADAGTRRRRGALALAYARARFTPAATRDALCDSLLASCGT